MTSVRTRLVLSLLVVLGAALVLAGYWTTGIVSDALLSDTVSGHLLNVSRLSVTLSERMAAERVDAFYPELTQAARQLGGRLLVVDTDDKVVFDTRNERCGQILPRQEIVSVLRGERDSDYGYHAEEGQGAERWEGCFAAGMRDGAGRLLGALVFSVSIQDTVERVLRLRDRMATLFVVAAAAVLFIAALISGLLMRPVGALSAGIDRMSRGDYTTPVHVRGRGEMADLAAAFNDMCDKVRSLDETRSQFVANASHELKTPLATMKILVESLLYEDDMEPETRKEFLNDINREIDRLSRVVGDLLTLARIDSRKLTLNRERISFAEVAEESMKSLRPLAERHRLSMTFEAGDPCVMEADGERLRQVCYNLVSNAVKYTPDGGSIRVMIRREGRDAVLQVSDTGIGIAEADLPHVFDRFYRADKARARMGESGGTGLGLSIVRQIVRLHAGTVTVKSAPGEGTTFTVQLPLL